MTEEVWIVKLMELTEMAKLTTLIRENTLILIVIECYFWTFCVKQKKIRIMTYGFDWKKWLIIEEIKVMLDT